MPPFKDHDGPPRGHPTMSRRMLALTAVGLALGVALMMAHSSNSAAWSEIWHKALRKAFKGGAAGFVAGVFQVICFMWLRTAMNHQYANGGNLVSALQHLWGEGGVLRFYKGLTFAIIQAPLTRFGDTFMNGLTLVLFAPTTGVGTSLTTLVSSTLAAAFRVLCTPIDTLKTSLQVHGDGAYNVVLTKFRQKGISELFAGWEANYIASWLGNYPWFAVHNYMDATIPVWVGPWRHVRSGLIGIAATTASDCVSNSMRVVKTIRQTHPDPEHGYVAAVRSVLQKEGVVGLLGRGLATRLLVNVLQGVFFTMLWHALAEL
eukprot:Sspe_Gene.115132::Locus_102051_Transcript_1_1_Confidence_1.000_Length_1029::g.115132::m.115132